MNKSYIADVWYSYSYLRHKEQSCTADEISVIQGDAEKSGEASIYKQFEQQDELSDNYDLFKRYFADNMMNIEEKQFLVISIIFLIYEKITLIQIWNDNIVITNVRARLNKYSKNIDSVICIL